MNDLRVLTPVTRENDYVREGDERETLSAAVIGAIAGYLIARHSPGIEWILHTLFGSREAAIMSPEDAMALLIPILAITLSLGALIVWIVVWSRRRTHEVDCRHKERMAAIEKGLELPPESLPQPEQMPPRSRYLLRGLIWLGVGLAVTFGGHEWMRAPMGGSGWIAVAVGAAYLVFYFVEGRGASVPKPEESGSGGDQTP